MLFSTRGSTDLPLRGVTFATEGVDDFMEGGMKIDSQDFVGKMEGFAVQGIKGLFIYLTVKILFIYCSSSRCCEEPPATRRSPSFQPSPRNPTASPYVYPPISTLN
jgi:hypothetical protein